MSDDDKSSLYDQASQELNVRLIEEFGNSDYQNTLLIIATNPANYIDGRWGFSHAAITIVKLETLRLSGGSDSQIQNLAYSEIAYWYSREAVARCSDNITNWINPLNWSEDGRLDYMTPLLFSEWYINNLYK